MAEVLISPGVLARENDQSQITAGPIQAGAAIIGPTVKGQNEVPTLITSYSEYLASYGSTFISGSNQYTYFTSISAYNYFQNGGATLLVTRVASASITPATSSRIQSTEETGTILNGTNLFGSMTPNTGNGGVAFSGLVTPTGGSGTGLTLTVTTDNSAGKLSGSFDYFQASPTQAVETVGDFDDMVATVVAPSGGVNTGTGAQFELTFGGGAGAASITALTATTTGSGYSQGDTFIWDAATLNTAIGGGSAGTGVLTLTLGVGTSLFIETTGLSSGVQSEGYAVGDVITVGAANMGFPQTALSLTLKASDIPNFEAFKLETIGDGAIYNSGYGDASLPSGNNGTLGSGSADNYRWEITTPNTSSGTFGLLIRQGNDTNSSKAVIETYPNLSLDPLASNYISRVIGDQTDSLRGAGSSDVYLQTSGSFPNASRFVRVSKVDKQTPNYLDNDGNAKSQFTASLPFAQSGSFGSAVGNGTGGTVSVPLKPHNFYSEIDNINQQGLVGADYDDAIRLLANRDEYRYNVITAPGLILDNGTTGAGWTTIQSNCENRGDAIFVGDLANYNSSLTQVGSTAASVDSSYVATYWPWLMVTDPDSRQLVWVPASTLIPGVYAYNDRAGEPWFAPAGINRGGLGSVRQAERKLTNANRDTLYTAKVNPIATFPGTGIVVFGQKTLQTKASALDRVNVRRLLITLKNYISQIADTLVFEQNTAATRNTFLSQVNPYLESVQQRQGLYAFKVVMDNTNNTPDVIDRNQLIGAVYLQPTKTAEFIYLDFNILPTGATFPA